MPIKFIAFLQISLLLFNDAFAQVVPLCPTSLTNIYFVNGVSPDADRNRDQSIRALDRCLSSKGIITSEEIVSLRNPSNGLAMDVLIEMTNMKVSEALSIGKPTTFAKAWYSVILMVTGDPSYVLSATDQALLTQKYPDLITRSSTGLNGGTNAVLQSMINTILPGLQAGSKTIIVAHSQGNLFANAILRDINANQPAEIAAGLKVVGVASPAAEAQDISSSALTSNQLSGRYGTAYQDVVIRLFANAQALITGTPSPLPANIDVSGANLAGDVLSHGFVETYINPNLNGATQVVGLIQDAVNKASPVSNGFLNITTSANGILWINEVVTAAPVPGTPIPPIWTATKQNLSSGGANPINMSVTTKLTASCDTGVMRAGTFQFGILQMFNQVGQPVTVQVHSNQGLTVFDTTVTPTATQATNTLVGTVTFTQDPVTGTFNYQVN